MSASGALRARRHERQDFTADGLWRRAGYGTRPVDVAGLDVQFAIVDEDAAVLVPVVGEDARDLADGGRLPGNVAQLRERVVGVEARAFAAHALGLAFLCPPLRAEL